MVRTWILLVSLLASWTHSYPSGGPTTACQTLLPKHPGAEPQTDATPYIISPETQQIAEGTRLRVTITSSQGIPIEGFMIQARPVASTIPIGKFTDIPGDLTHYLQCSAEADTVTHSSKQSKPSVEVEWEAPPGYLGRVVFAATVAQGYATYWPGVESTPVEIVKRSAGLPTGISTTRQPIRPTTTPLNYVPDKEEQNSNGGGDLFYNGCGTTKSCFGAPGGCVEMKNCKAAVAVLVRGERYEFELRAIRGAAYVAVGLSDDDKMGDDSTIECVLENDEIKAYMGYTNPRPKLDALRLTRPTDGIKLLNKSSIDGAIYCRVQRDAKTVVQGKTYDLINDQYNLLIAAGGSVHPNKVSFHTIAYEASGNKKSLADVSGFTAASKILLRLHGAFMVTAWIGTASVGILLARYFRQTWVGTQLCGKDQWFAWHRFFMVLTWVLTMAGFIMIFVELKAWSSEKNPHAILGVVTTVICFLQPFGAYLRPHPGTPNRAFFNWGHWLAGNVAHILAIVTIFFAVKLNKAELPEWMDWILVAFVAFHVFMHLVLSILGCISDRPSGHRVSSFPMKEMGQGRNAVHPERKMDAPHSCFRKFLLAVYLLGVLVLVVGLLVVIVCAPIEDMWDSVQKSLNMT